MININFYKNSNLKKRWKPFTYTFVKNLQKVVAISTIIFVYYYTTIDNVQCAALSSHTTPTQQLTDLINSFTPIELEEFNRHINNFPERALLAIVINITIFGVVYYGPTIFHGVLNFIANIPNIIGDFAHNITVNAPAYLFESAREFALRRIANANPEQTQELLNIARQIAANRINTGGAA